MHTPSRRTILFTGGLSALALFSLSREWASAKSVPGIFPVAHSDAEWHHMLNARQYDVLRLEGTETPFTSPLNQEHRSGTFACAGCAQPVFSSKTKFESGTGWPSFWAPIDDAVASRSDRSLIMERTEIHCSRCGGHLGHVFNDGPQPTGLRYCMNGVAMTFKAEAT